MFVFASTLLAQTYQVIHTFSGADGRTPHGVVADAWGNLYGVTNDGGPHDLGTVFRLDAANGYALTTLHTFTGPDGLQPQAPVLADASGNLYGTTSGGGPGGYGTVFRLDAADGYALTTLHGFGQGDVGPEAGVVADASGNLYGTTPGGGQFGYGTVFRLDASNGYSLTTLHSFSEPGSPHAGVVLDASGNLYGTTYGNYDPTVCGTVFKLDAANAYALTTLHAFIGTDGCHSFASLLADASGNLYGTTVGEPDPTVGYPGNVFELRAADGYSLTVLHAFADVGPDVALAADASGALFGTATFGSNGMGIVFSLGAGMPAPVGAIAPTSGPAIGGTSVTVTGVGFSPPASVRIGGALATEVVVVSPTEITARTPPLPPGRLNDVAVTTLAMPPGTPDAPLPVADPLPGAFLSDFDDVPQSDIFHADVEKVFRNGITAGCGGGYYCRDGLVTRAQAAVLLLKAGHGSSFAPPPCAGLFSDVECAPSPAFAADWIEQLANEGISAGCGPGRYCPGEPVTRAQGAPLLLKAKQGSTYVPPACSGMFLDVACTPSPAFAADWIEELAREGITAGCGGGNYCPGSPVGRGQMATFLVRTFQLP